MTAIDSGLLFSRCAETWENDVLPALASYIAIPCLSPAFDADWQQRGAISEAAALLLEWSNDRDLGEAAIEIVALEGRTPCIVAEFTSEHGDGPTTLIYGHFDKQPPLGTWRAGLSAFEAVREGDHLYGRGAADDGYACFAAMTALETMRAQSLRRGSVIVLLESSEESGSPDLDAYLEHLAARLGEVGLVICLDSGGASYDRLWVTTSLRGVLVGELRVDVLDEGVHSGLAGGIVPSSFRIARALLSRLEDERTGAVTLDALCAPIPPHRNEEMHALGAEFGFEAAGSFPSATTELFGATPTERIEAGTWRPSLEVTGVAGIPSLEQAGNVLRPFTALKVSIRLPPNVDATAASQAVGRLLTADPPQGARVTFHCDQAASGWDAPALAPWLSRALDEASRSYFGAPLRGMGLGGSIPFMAALGARFPSAQFLATGVLGPQSNAHGPNEFLHIPTAKALTACVAHVLCAASQPFANGAGASN